MVQICLSLFTGFFPVTWSSARYRDAASACISPGRALGLAESVQLNILTNQLSTKYLESLRSNKFNRIM